MNCEILAIGTELLLGNIVNTNAQFLSEELANIGIDVYRHTVVGDNFHRVITAIEEGFTRADIIITTGGLGPTKDDMTKEAVGKYFNKKLILDEEQKVILENLFKSRGYPLTENNYRQVYFPEGAIIMPNNNGTAPGVIINENGKMLLMFPGPPNELKPMWNESGFKFLQEKSSDVFVSKTLNFLGIGESALEDTIEDIIEAQSNPTVAPYAKDGYVILRITAKGKDKNYCKEIMKPTIEAIKSKVGNFIFGEDECLPQEAVVNSLIKNNKTIAIAESCTGGLVTSTLVEVDGVSQVLIDSVVTYSNESKISRINVSNDIIDKYGAVSQECAKAMAEGIRVTSGANIGVSITGIAGNSGGTEDKPVGLVYIGISTEKETRVYKYNFGGKRNHNRRRATLAVYTLLLKMLG